MVPIHVRSIHWTLLALIGLSLSFLAGAALAQETNEPAPPPTTTAKTPPPVHQVKTVYTKQNAPAASKLEDLPLKESVSQYGITWTFDKPARVGQFINGDWYVVGEVTVKMIDPKPLWGNEVTDQIDKSGVKESRYPGKQCRNGSSLNPAATGIKSGFDSRLASDRYDPERVSLLPIAMKPGDVLVSTISRPTSQLKSFDGQKVDPLKVGAVLCSVAEPLPADAFRPSYCDSKNSRVYLARNLRRELLTKLPKLPDMPENLDAYAAKFQKVWLDIAQWGFAAPIENLPHYGQQFTEQTSEASLLLLSDYTPEQKETLLVNFTQAGIDFWGLVRAGHSWPAHGGLNSGRKWPVLFAGLMFDDADMLALSKKYPKTRFHEDDQTAFGPVTLKDKTYEKSWSGAKAIFMGHSPGLSGEKGHWDRGWGLVDVLHPKDWPLPGKLTSSEGYRRANTSACWVGQALAARIMHAEKYWDHDAFFAYVDRWMTEDDTPLNAALKEAGRADYNANKPGEFGRQGYVHGPAWVKGLWLKYRNAIPPAADGTKTPPAETTWK